MDISGLDAGGLGPEVLEQLTGLTQAQAVADAGMGVLDQVLEVQQQTATQLLQAMGVGTNLDLLA